MKSAVITLQSGHGRYLCVDHLLVIADREFALEWEHFGIEPRDGGKIAIKSHLGRYLTAEPDGRVSCRTDVVGEWEEWTPVLINDEKVALRNFHGKFLTAELDHSVRCRAVNAHAWEEWRCDTSWLSAATDEPRTDRPLVGRLRVQDKLFRDDSGYRRVLFCSWFPALRILRDNPPEFYRQIDAIAAAGYQGFRTFLAVGGWMDFWDGREVVPIAFTKWHYTGNHLRSERLGTSLQAWPDYDDLLRTLLRACRARGLRLHVTTGDMQVITGDDMRRERNLHERFARICAEEGGTDVIALAEMTNEFPLNRYGGQGPASIQQLGALVDIWRRAIPGVLTAQGAIPQNEEPESLELACTHGDVCAVHITRDPFAMCLKRTFGVTNWEGDWRAFQKAVWEGEPAGPGADSYQRLDDPSSLTALYAMHALLGHGSVQFSGPAVRSREPLEAVWGFTQLPRILSVLPEDIATWDHASDGRGGIMYFFRGDRFATATTREWDPSPPRPIDIYTLYAGDTVVYGTGTPPRATGLIVGRFK